MRRSVALLTLLFAACSGGGGDDAGPITPPPTPTIAVSLAPGAGTAARGATTTTTVSLTRGGGYAGTVTLAADALPAGVQVSFAPATLSGTTTSATATIFVSNTAAAGNATVNISASGSGVTTASAAFALTVPTPTIGVTTAASALTVTQGTSGNVGITVSRTNGFADAIALAATGVPAGVTATFAPASVAAGSSASTLALAVSATAAPGSYPITVTASGTGVSNATATVTLTVAAAATPAFGLSAAPAALSLVAGQSATSTITAARTGGFAGEVALAISGAPAGMTATVSPATLGASVTTASVSVTTTGAVAPGSYTLTVNGTGTGVQAQSTTIGVTVAAAPAIGLALASGSLSTAAGTPVSTGVTLTRLGDFAGDVALAVQGLPSGVTAAFAPATLTGATLASTLTLTVGGAVPAGSYPLSVSASGTGVSAATASLSLTVSAAQGYSLTATAVNLTQGGTATSAVTINRTGGFAGSVALAVSGLPSGVTATVNPASTTGTSAAITFNAAGNASTGAFTATLTGTATGLANVTTSIGGSVAGAPTGGSISWTFCETERFPVWFAVQSGTGGAWNAVTPSGTTTRVYSFNISGSVGGVAYAIPRTGGGTDVSVLYFSSAELGQQAVNECVSNRSTKTLNGSVANVPAGAQAVIGVGGATAAVSGPATTFTVTNVDDGPTDIVGVRSVTMPTSIFPLPDRGVLRRNQNYAAGTTIPVLDFTGAESFAVASADYTVANATGEQIILTSSFVTQNGFTGTFTFFNPLITGPTQKVYGVPLSSTVSGDLHQVLAIASSDNGASSRRIAQYNRELTNRTLTLGPALSSTAPTSLGSSPYPRFTVSGSWQTEYADAVGVSFFQQAQTSNTWTVTLSRSYSGSGATWTLAVPNVAGVSGFNTAWGLANASTNWSLTGLGGLFAPGNNALGFGEGGTFRSASRTGTVSP